MPSNHACPNCQVRPAKLPARSYTCKSCGEKVHVRKLAHGRRIFLLDDRAKAFDAVVRLARPLAAQLSDLADAVRADDYHAAVVAYLEARQRQYQAVEYQVEFGLDYETTQRRMHHADLLRMREGSKDPARGVFIVAGFSSCDRCRALEHRWFSFAEAIAAQVLPHRDCVRPYRRGRPRCECRYFPASADQEDIVYWRGGGGGISLSISIPIEPAGVSDKVSIEYIGGPLDGSEVVVAEPSTHAVPVFPDGRYQWDGNKLLRWTPRE